MIILTEIVKQAEVLSTVLHTLQCTYPEYKVRFIGNWPEKFKKPCFFVGATSVMRPQTTNWSEKELTIKILYYPSEASRQLGTELEFMKVVDTVQALFPVGISTNGRFLKIDSIEDDRVGEEHDILEITITIPYLERVNRENESQAELMQEVVMTGIHDGGRNQQEMFDNDIVSREEEQKR